MKAIEQIQIYVSLDKSRIDLNIVLRHIQTLLDESKPFLSRS